MLAEFTAMLIALYVAISATELFRGMPLPLDGALSFCIAGFFTTALFSMGFYSREIVYGFVVSAQRFLATYLIFFAGLYLVVELALPTPSPDQARIALLLTAVSASAALLVPLVRIVAVHALSLSWLKRRLLVVGGGTKAMKLHRTVTEKLRHEADVVAVVRFCDEPDGSNRGPELISCEDGNLLELCMSLAVEEIVVARDNQRGMPIGDLLACRTIGIRVREYISFLEEEIGYIDVDELRPSALIFSWGFDRTPIFLATKRLFDIGVSLFLLVFTLPLTILAAIAIRLDSPGPILFRQDRVGLDSRRFQVLKFRSMRVDAEREGPQWAALKDARVTRIGAMLRKTRIDEIPQLINVLKGDMSFVGPRPERPFFVDSLRAAIPFYDERHKMKPGLTGWAQINYPYGASVEDAKEKLAYDLYYAKSASMILDVIIALQTIKVVLFPRGAR
jgi:sugar transferase (PEP-CTERM system associated)